MADQRQEVVRALGEALATTEAAHCIDLGPVGELVHRRFGEICKGNRFDFGPVHALLISMEGVTEAGIYVGVVRFKSVLAGMGLTLTEPNWTIGDDVRKELMRKARAAQQQGAQEMTQKVADIVAERPRKKSGIRMAFTPGGKKGAKGRNSAGRLAVYLVLLAVSGFCAWRFQPVRDLSTNEYAKAFPLQRVQLHDGVFVGFADMTTWKGMDPGSRSLATKALEETLKREGYLGDAAVVDEQGKMIVFDVKGKRLEIAEGWKN